MNPITQHPIVMVDDEKSYTGLMSHMLEVNLGWRVITFSHPLEALSALPSLQPPVIVTDYYMPQLSGLEFIRLAAPLTPASAFVLISGHNLGDVEDEMARLRGLKAQLSKPFGWRRLADEIARVWPATSAVPLQPLRAAV